MKTLFIVMGIAIIIGGCLPIGGRPFPYNNAYFVEKGQTKNEVRGSLGEPWEVKTIENNIEVWNYYSVMLKLFIWPSVNNINIYFDNNAIVTNTLWVHHR